MTKQPPPLTAHDNAYDLIIIGTGPAGESAALKAAKQGLKVAVIEARSQVGGNCIHSGTIPSKALRHIVAHFAFHKKYHDYTYPQMLENAQRVIQDQVDLREGFYHRNNIQIIHGHASFVDAHTIQVKHEDYHETFQAKYFVIATGSRPYRPDTINFSNPRILDSDKILELQNSPKSITIYGAGIIGCEYASIFRNLKIKVNLINTREQLLSYLDDEIIDGLAYHLRENGVRIRHNESLQSVVIEDEQVILTLKSNKIIKSDYFLFAQGRTGNSEQLNLQTLGIQTNERGSIQVNEVYQTLNHPHIYAAGDVIGYPSLASAAFDQGRLAATHIIYGKCRERLIHDIPTGIYTMPEISSIGKTEKELTQARTPYEVGHAYFKDLARAQISNKRTGMLKILFHRETFAILGIHCFGNQASEIIHIGQAIMSQPGKANTLKYFINTTFNYPTMAEAYRVAALNGLNRL